MLRRLPETVVNRIAAGEVVERPASAVKELLENSLDAGARRIDIVVRNGGQSLIRVVDDGCGMTRDELDLCVERHATSKLDGEDLTDIRTLGFRGEALPSIAAVSRLTITSRTPNSPEAWKIQVDGGVKRALQPAAGAVGTTIDIRDLFFATPARLKFMKSPSTEMRHIVQVVQRLAIAYPDRAFSLTDDQRTICRFPANGADAQSGLLARLGTVFGNEFAQSALPVSAERDNMRLSGFISPPTVHRRQRANQMLFVNDRPIQDPVLYTVIRVAYQGLIATDRHPYAVLFLSVPASDVDVNVHPMKSEVRFREADRVRSLLIGGVKAVLGGLTAGQTATRLDLPSTRNATPWSNAFPEAPSTRGSTTPRAANSPNGRLPLRIAEPTAAYTSDGGETATAIEAEEETDRPLGIAKAQVHKTYIVAQNRDGLIIVDQHAAHERLVQEQIMASMTRGCVARQSLLIPEVVDLGDDAAARLIERSDDLRSLGLVVEGFGAGSVIVREIPAMLGASNIRQLIQDIADDLAVFEDALALRQRLGAVYARMACHHSVRAGRTLSIEEMNSLLRSMEQTPHSGQCSHGRPTFVQLRLDDLERLFGRK